jgi:hypothetical protein
MRKRDNDTPDDHRAEPTGAHGAIGNGKRGVTTAPATTSGNDPNSAAAVACLGARAVGAARSELGLAAGALAIVSGLPKENTHSIGFSGGQLSSDGEGNSALDFPLIHDTRSQDPP